MMQIHREVNLKQMHIHMHRERERTDDVKKIEDIEIKYTRKLRIHSRNRMQ